MTNERPAAPVLGGAKPRVLPKPAPDEAVDPIDSRVPVAAPAMPVAEVISAVAAVPVAPPVVEPPAEVANVPGPAQAAPAGTPAPAGKVRRQEVFVQVGSRVTVETRDLLDEIIAREGLSMRHTLEKMIRYYHSLG